jgi:hypothetical protein
MPPVYGWEARLVNTATRGGLIPGIGSKRTAIAYCQTQQEPLLYDSVGMFYTISAPGLTRRVCLLPICAFRLYRA